MTTVAEISLKVMKEVTDVITGTATGGSTTTLIDTTLLTTQPNDHFNNGRIWILSGTHAGKVFAITDFVQSTGTVTFAAVTGAIAAGVRYAIARNAYPWDQVVSAIQSALDTTYITALDSTLTGDGQTLEFTLPSGVFDVLRIETEDTADAHSGKYPAHHWREIHNGKIRFDFGYAPDDDYTIHVYYKSYHPELTDYTTTINNEIDVEWLRYKAAQELLWWGVTMYGQQVEYRIEERMNKVMLGLQRRTARRGIDITMSTPGA